LKLRKDFLDCAAIQANTIILSEKGDLVTFYYRLHLQHEKGIDVHLYEYRYDRVSHCTRI
jgi:hypothetical protein